ncbi:HAMP domain-containing sensor histidine kinase [Rufibacter sp. LB8]|uniref:sensor histidine kinase n=1 Tax=Rufibacter sp. LB8 TaxID=2777781 RepID=UPI00178C5D9D|nr:HAMP domain-containing sensor histidine kinase [Rufibacter sp. LB8]
MKKKTLLLVIALMSLSLIGLIGFQAYWIQHAVQMEEEVFDRNVSVALHQVARRLETEEAMHFLKEEAPLIRAAALTPVTPSMEDNAPAPTPARKAKAKKTTYKITFNAAPEDQQVLLTRPSEASTPPPAPATGFSVVTSTAQSPQSRVYLRSTTAAPHQQGATVKVFGKSKIDSVVVWKVLAAQAAIRDTLKTHSRSLAHRLRVDSGMVFSLTGDTVSFKNKLDLLNLIPARNIQEVNVSGNVINIFSDTLVRIAGHRKVPYALDSMARHRRFRSVVNSVAAKSANGSREVQVTDIVALPARAQLNPEPVEKTLQQKEKAKAQHLNNVIQQMAVEYARNEKPLAERLQQLKLKELLATELQMHNIQIPYHFKVETGAGNNSTITLASTNALSSAALPSPASANEYLVRLFPNDVLSAPAFLILDFPNRNYYVWQSLAVPTVISVLFTLIIILTFSFTLYTILRQKKISEIKNDFINNMTHEFKTPIATISLALDALVNPKVRKDEVRVDYYARIIKDENKRMHQQVEKVLQTAQMERQKLQLACEKVDVHALIQKVIEPFQLHIEQRQGSLDLKLDATHEVIYADPGHLANMVANLLDNANKYSPNGPRIVIQTANVSKGIHISVEDQGTGMSREAQKRVFEKFYRVPTGNVHNVKGFGLGLSYVKTMAEAHAGTIHLRSELGKGSRFTLWLPCQPHA